MSDILLATKIHIPHVRSGLIKRPHLVRRLNDSLASSCRLTLISAPAGYGKSTLLSEWVSQLEIPVAWLSLEKVDNTSIRFWCYIYTALLNIPYLHEAGMGETALYLLRSSQPPEIDMLLTILLNDLARLDGEAVLVLDDLHSITESQIHQNLIYLIDHLPQSTKSLHLVIASRRDPPWPLARWRGRDEIIELRASDLRFSEAEALQFLNQTLQLKLSTQDVTALQERTEGWIAGLQMAGVSMQGRLRAQGMQGVSHFIENFTGSNRFILDYLMEEVISQQPEELRDFLHATSILDQLTASLCDAMTGRGDSQAILEQVEQANLFLLPLDDERQWYRYHHLFAELLLKSLKQSQPDRIPELHRRASNWYAENNYLSDAISHAFEAEDIMRVNELLSGNALAMVAHAELFDVLRHFEEMPEGQISSRPWLCVAYAWVKAYVDPSSGLDDILQQTEQCLAVIENDLERRHITGHLDAIRAYTAWVRGEADMALGYTGAALENLPEDDWMTRSHVLNTEGLAYQYKLDLARAKSAFEAAILAAEKTGRFSESFYAYTNLAFSYFLQGRLHQAFNNCQHVLSIAEKSGQVSIHMPVLAYAYATLSEVQLEWNDVESAITHARQGVALAEQWHQADTLHYALTCLSEALCAAGDLEEAFSLNKQAMQLGSNVSPWFFRISAYEEIIFNLAKGDIPAAAHRFREIEPLSKESDKRGKYQFVRAALLLAQGNYDELLITLEDAIDELEEKEINWYLLKLLPCQALALNAMDRKEEALSVIRRCIALAEPEGFVRIFVERGAPMIKLLTEAYKRGIATEYIERLLPVFDASLAERKIREPITPPTQSRLKITGLVEPLSQRELEVLRLLEAPLTSDEIASELYISVNTIRTHIRNIYSKLDVHGRMEAIQRAKDLGLI